VIEVLTSFVEESKAKEGQLEKETAELRAELKRAEAEETEGSPTSR